MRLTFDAMINGVVKVDATYNYITAQMAGTGLLYMHILARSSDIRVNYI